jgi:hypothetical protein
MHFVISEKLSRCRFAKVLLPLCGFGEAFTPFAVSEKQARPLSSRKRSRVLYRSVRLPRHIHFGKAFSPVGVSQRLSCLCCFGEAIRPCVFAEKPPRDVIGAPAPCRVGKALPPFAISGKLSRSFVSEKLPCNWSLRTRSFPALGRSGNALQLSVVSKRLHYVLSLRTRSPALCRFGESFPLVLLSVTPPSPFVCLIRKSFPALWPFGEAPHIFSIPGGLPARCRFKKAIPHVSRWRGSSSSSRRRSFLPLSFRRGRSPCLHS